MSKEIVSSGNDFTLEWVDRSYGGRRRNVMLVDGDDGSVTMGDLTISATGDVSIAGASISGGSITADTTVSSGKDLIAAGGASDIDWHLSSGAWKSPTGTFTLNGPLSVASGVDVAAAGGASDWDYSLSSGVWKGPSGLNTFAGKIAAGAAAWVVADPGNAGAVAVTASGVCLLTSAGAETRTLAVPTFVGQKLALICDTYVGNIVITAAASINQANNTIMTFGQAADMIELTAMKVGGALRWRVTANDGVALS